MRALLLSTAQQICGAAAIITRRRDDKVREESTKVIDFQPFSRSAWDALGDGPRNGSRGYHAGGEAGSRMAQIIGSIRKQTLAHSSFGTEKSALVRLRKIGKSIILTGACDEFGSEVLNTLHLEEPSLDKV